MIAVQFLWYDIGPSPYPFIYVGMIIGVVALSELWNWLSPIKVADQDEDVPEDAGEVSIPKKEKTEAEVAETWTK